MLKKIVALAVSALMLTSVLAGCGSSGNAPKTSAEQTTTTTATSTAAATTQDVVKTPIKLVYLNGTVEMVDFWNQYFQKYNADNKDGITVEHQYQKEATKTLQVRMASGETTDLLSCSVTQDMMDNGKFVDLTDSTWWSQLNPAVKGFCTDVKSGKAYNIATLQGAVGIYYNKSIFNELGLKPANTWEEFVANLRVIKEKKPGVVPFYMGGKDGWMLSHLAEFTFQAAAKQSMSYTDQQTAMLSNNLAKLGWDATENGPLVKFAADFMGLQKEGLINKNIVTATYDNQTTEFATGKAAVISQGLWAAGDIEKKIANTSNIGFCQYPTIIDGIKPAIGSTIDGQFYISADSKNIEAAKKVLETILQPDNMKAISEARKAPSSNPSVQSEWGYLKDDVGKVLADANVANVTWTTMPSGFSGDDQGRVLQEMFAGKYKQPVDFAKAWVNAWNKGFSK